jgi:LmbE family N-acetylglucosaminyl deacetylase
MDIGDIVGVWAHPDDECYLSAGLMATAIRAGRKVTVVMATLGQVGTDDPERWPPEALAELREEELRNSLAVVGVADLRLLGYFDGRCAEVDSGEAIGAIEAILRERRPRTVLTFGPEGMTGHSDHIAVSRWTTAAFERVALPDARLMYATYTQRWIDEFKPALDQFNVFEVPPPVTRDEDLAIHLQLDDELVDIKTKAAKEHASQIQPLMDALGLDFFHRGFRNEYYRAADLGLD